MLAADKLARPKRFELLTPRFVVWCSIQLSYGRAGFVVGARGPGSGATHTQGTLAWQAAVQPTSVVAGSVMSKRVPGSSGV